MKHTRPCQWGEEKFKGMRPLQNYGRSQCIPVKKKQASKQERSCVKRAYCGKQGGNPPHCKFITIKFCLLPFKTNHLFLNIFYISKITWHAWKVHVKKYIYIFSTLNLLNYFFLHFDMFSRPVIARERDVCLTCIDLSHQHLTIHQTVCTHTCMHTDKQALCGLMHRKYNFTLVATPVCSQLTLQASSSTWLEKLSTHNNNMALWLHRRSRHWCFPS